MEWSDIQTSFPNQWVVVAHSERLNALAIRGDVVGHSLHKQELAEILPNLLQRYGSVAVQYTGALLSNSDLPMLWRISPTKPTSD